MLKISGLPRSKAAFIELDAKEDTVSRFFGGEFEIQQFAQARALGCVRNVKSAILAKGKKHIGPYPPDKQKKTSARNVPRRGPFMYFVLTDAARAL